MTVKTKATRLNVDLRSTAAHITWNADRSGSGFAGVQW